MEYFVCIGGRSNAYSGASWALYGHSRGGGKTSEEDQVNEGLLYK
jgi:hypothetical protein